MNKEKFSSDELLTVVLGSTLVDPIDLVNGLIDYNPLNISQELISAIVTRYLEDSIKIVLENTTINKSWLLYNKFGAQANFVKLMGVAKLSSESIKGLIKCLKNDLIKEFAYPIIKQDNFTKDVYIDPEIFEIMSPFYSFIKKKKDWYDGAEDVQLLEVINNLGNEKEDQLKLVESGQAKQLKSCKKFSLNQIQNHMNCFDWFNIISYGKPIDKDLEIKVLGSERELWEINLDQWTTETLIKRRSECNKPMSFELKVAIIKNFIRRSCKSEYWAYYYESYPWSTSFYSTTDGISAVKFGIDKDRLLNKVLKHGTLTNLAGYIWKFLDKDTVDTDYKEYIFENVLNQYCVFDIARELFCKTDLSEKEIKELKKIKLESPGISEVEISIKLSNGRKHILTVYDIINAEDRTNNYKLEKDKFYFVSGTKYTTTDETSHLYCIDLSKK